jgi:hypothetical protein
VDLCCIFQKHELSFLLHNFGDWNGFKMDMKAYLGVVGDDA